MAKLTLPAIAALAIIALSTGVRTQEPSYPITVVPPGKGPFTFPPGYQTPWDKIQIMVTAKMSPNLFVLHGTEGLDPAHPDASGGRVMALFGPERLAPASGASLPGRRPGRDGSEPRAASWYWSSRASPARTCATSLR